MIWLFDSLKKSFSSYTSNPVGFALNSLFLVFYQVLVLLAIAGLWFVVFFIASILQIGVDSIPFLAIDALLIVMFVYFSAGIKGSYVWACNESVEGRRVSMLEFFRYFMRKSGVFFFITLLKYFFTALFVAPVILAYLYVLVDYDVPYLDVLVYLTAALLAFLIHFMFYPAIISAAVYDTSISRSIRGGFQLVRKRNILALMLYVVYAITWILNFIPLIQLFTLFVTYPIIYSAMILMFKDAVPKEMLERKVQKEVKKK